MSKINISFSATGLDLFLLCPARFYYGHEMRKTLPIIHRARALDYGAIGHKGLEEYNMGLKEGLHYNDRMHKTIMKMREFSSSPDDVNINVEEVDVVIRAVEQSCDYWRSEDEHLEILAVEAPFDYVLYEDDDYRIIISGKIDLLTNKYGIGNNATYMNLPTDHKFYLRDFPVYRLSNQFMNYVKAANSNFILINRVGLQKTVAAEEKFKRVPLSYDPLIIEQWRTNTIRIIIDHYTACVASGGWFMNFTSCYKFNRLCEFYAVCDASGEEAKQFTLEAQYIENKHYDKYEKEGE